MKNRTLELMLYVIVVCVYILAEFIIPHGCSRAIVLFDILLLLFLLNRGYDKIYKAGYKAGLKRGEERARFIRAMQR